MCVRVCVCVCGGGGVGGYGYGCIYMCMCVLILFGLGLARKVFGHDRVASAMAFKHHQMGCRNKITWILD